MLTRVRKKGAKTQNRPLCYSYDGAGNPTSYYNIGNLSNWTLTWKNGRELATAGKTGVSLSFDYDVDGLRTEKTVSSSNTHRYLYASGLLLQDRYTRNGFIYELEFVYDANGRPFALVYTCDGSTTVYYYVLNAQGDVIRLVNGSGATIANYEYDPYGRLLSVKNANGSSITNPTSIAHLNPLRYRSYYYDTETGWYYLQSRYYDPILKRFLNADGYASTGQGFLGYNMFTYCLNNPVNRADANGHASSTTEDKNGNGIPDYLEERWLALTERSKKQLGSSATTYYSTMDEAAHAGGTMAARKTRQTNLEYAYEIYRDGDSYYLSSIIEGEHDGVSIGDSPTGNLVAAVHSHPYCTGHDANHFSISKEGVLYGDASVAYSLGIVIYLASPNGRLQKMTVKDSFVVGEVIININDSVATDLPVDRTIFDCLG